MQLKKMVVLVGVLCSGSLFAAQSATSVDEKLAQLEAQIEALKQQQAASQQAAPVVVQSEKPVNKDAPPKLTLSGFGDIKFYGDVEFNMDAASKTGSLTSVKQSANSDWAPGDKERWDINGRILLGFDGYRKMDNGHFSGFSVQPLGDLAGQMYLDDAVFFFGAENDWEIKVGRFEAYDMFPLNQDTFVEYSGNTADDLYSDGYGYIYMLKEGRGRTASGGNFLMSKTLDNWYFELNTLFKDGSDLYVDQRYYDAELENDKNVAYVRPVISWQDGPFSTAVAMETNLVNNAYGYRDDAGRWVDQSDRTGYGFTMTWAIFMHITKSANLTLQPLTQSVRMIAGSPIRVSMIFTLSMRHTLFPT